MILKLIATGRPWGNKVAPSISTPSIGGVKCIVTEQDIWEGPDNADQQGQYYRGTWLELASKARDDRFQGQQVQ